MIITGTGSGLGKHLYDNEIDRCGPMDRVCVGWNRKFSFDQHNIDKLKENSRDKNGPIIHCASSRSSISTDQFVKDTFVLTDLLTSVPHTKFIFVSTVDVYPVRNRMFWNESEKLDEVNARSLHAISKLMLEGVVRSLGNYLILRCSAMLGRDSKKNSLIKILDDDPCVLSVSSDSIFDFILHSDVERFILRAIREDITGVWNLCTSSPINIYDAAVRLRPKKMKDHKVRFGSFRYDVGKISNVKVREIDPIFNRTSWDTIKQFISERK